MKRHLLKITKFDVFLALALIALFFVILSGIVAPKGEGELDEVILTVKAEGVSCAVAEELSHSALFLLDEKYELSRMDATVENARILVNSGGALLEAESLTKKTVTLSLSAKGALSDAGFLIEKIRFLAPNMEVKISSVSTEATVKIIAIGKSTPRFR